MGDAFATMDPIVDPGTLGFRDDDQDTVPQGNGVVGDGLINFEELRGFVVRGQHRRTNPYTRDLFIDSTLDTNIGYATNLPLLKHWVWPNELSTNADPMSPVTFLVNSYYVNSGTGGTLAAHANQRGIRVREQPFLMGEVYGQSPQGCGEFCTPNFQPPAGVAVQPVSIYIQAIRASTPTDDDLFLLDYADDVAIMKTTGHKVGHVINMPDVQYSPGIPITLMIRGYFPWVNSEWSNIPTQYGAEDLIFLQVR